MGVPANYPEFVSTGTFADSERDKKFLVAMGLAGESGEVCDYLKKVTLHGKPLDRAKLREELGDVLWYLQLACNVFDIPMDEVAHENIVKLCKRYPDGYGDPDEWFSERRKPTHMSREYNMEKGEYVERPIQE